MDKTWLKKNSANIITSFRIVGTVVMIFMPTLTKGFFLAYLFAGITDGIDGFVARKFGIASDFGRKLDSIADLFFYVTMMLKILPFLILYLPLWVMITIFAITGIRLLMYVYVAMSKRGFMSNHTILNKATGTTLFLVPFLIKTKVFTAYAILVCAIAAAAAAHEGWFMAKQIKAGK